MLHNPFIHVGVLRTSHQGHGVIKPTQLRASIQSRSNSVQTLLNDRITHALTDREGRGQMGSSLSRERMRDILCGHGLMPGRGKCGGGWEGWRLRQDQTAQPWE